MSNASNNVICELYIDAYFKPYALKIAEHSCSRAVCGAVSSLVLSTLNSIEQLIGAKQVYQISPGSVVVLFNFMVSDHEAESKMLYLLLANLVIALSSISEEYPGELSFYIRPHGAFEHKDFS